MNASKSKHQKMMIVTHLFTKVSDEAKEFCDTSSRNMEVFQGLNCQRFLVVSSQYEEIIP